MSENEELCVAVRCTAASVAEVGLSQRLKAARAPSPSNPLQNCKEGGRIFGSTE